MFVSFLQDRILNCKLSTLAQNKFESIGMYTWLQLLMMFVSLKESFEQAKNKHMKNNISLCRTDPFSRRLLKSQKVCYEKK